ncbi:fatty acyl CoA synthetase [Trypanosoma theileri]|uniref:Fatty acyl CoA synthetase n=1 Tax=Trypanosoma theileri TaxID=67003 RepID=A0A1X0P8N7_9TRYP|nr:fatty acyl CoA synthetase [Trypanosoma theileri]ORC93314.1 fatty acyl CoA synthetase [Trypanosoma theileri]
MGGCVASVLDKRNEWSVVDFPEYQSFMRLKKQAEPVPGTEKANASPIYRMVGTSEEEHKKLVHDYYHGETPPQCFARLCKERGNRKVMLYRLLKEVERNTVTDKYGNKKTLETYVFEPKPRSITYTELLHRVQSLAKGLTEIGLQKGEFIGIYEDTRWEWYCTVQAIWSCQMVAATVYANLGEDALIYALQESQCRAIVCNGKNVKKLISLMKNSGVSNTLIIYLDDLPKDTDTTGFQVYSWVDVMKKGETSSKALVNIPGPENCDDLSLVMYTSGTTGNPKGVKHTHGTLGSGFKALSHRVLDLLGEVTEPETYCAYLPLAHIMELGVVTVLFNRGCVIGFGNPRTLTNNFAKPHGDFAEYRPVIVVAVPRIFDTIKKAVEAKLPPPGSFKRTVFDHAYQSRLKALKEGKDTPYYNQKVFAQPRQAMGGKVRVMLSGGGPMSPSTQEFINVIFGMIIQGWGLTETVCCGGIQRTGNLQYDNVGQILKSVEVRLLDTAEYRHTDKPEPRGEILLRGPFLFKGYYKQDEFTKESIDEDGWFHTGDVGSFTENGTLSIVGRVKALAKNSNGEYIALEVLESIYSQNDLCTPNGVCVLVHPGRSYIAAIAITTGDLTMQFAKKNHISGKFPDILRDPEFRKKAIESFQETARKAGRKSFEIVQNVQLLGDEWTPENDVLTAAMKLKRRVIDVRYKDLINELFKEDL